MKIIESIIVGKKNHDSCEDCLVITDGFVAVIDGSTSKTPFQISNKMKNGRFAALLISEYIERELPDNATIDVFCTGVTKRISDQYKSLNLQYRLTLHPEERLTTSAIIYSRERKEVWMVGDCQALVNGVLYENPKPYENEIARKRVELISQGMPPQDARKHIEPQLIAAMLDGQNKQYAVIDGFPIFMQGVKVISCQQAHGEIVLASDGYPFLLPTLEESEAALAHQITVDPQNVSSFIATKGLMEGNKSFDDRTYVRFI